MFRELVLGDREVLIGVMKFTSAVIRCTLFRIGPLLVLTLVVL